MKNTTLSCIWGGLWVLCALFGFLPEPSGAVEVFLMILSLLFFLPPGWLLVNARREKNGKLLSLLRKLSAGVLIAALLLLILSILTVAAPSWVGTALHVLLTVLCAPLVTGGNYALGLFFWACLLFAAKPEKNGKNP